MSGSPRVTHAAAPSAAPLSRLPPFTTAFLLNKLPLTPFQPSPLLPVVCILTHTCSSSVSAILTPAMPSVLFCPCRRRWGCKLSAKLFIGKKFVIKHITTKHDDKMAAQREKVRSHL